MQDDLKLCCEFILRQTVVVCLLYIFSAEYDRQRLCLKGRRMTCRLENRFMTKESILNIGIFRTDKKTQVCIILNGIQSSDKKSFVPLQNFISFYKTWRPPSFKKYLSNYNQKTTNFFYFSAYKKLFLSRFPYNYLIVFLQRQSFFSFTSNKTVP